LTIIISFFLACRNELVTEGILRYLLEYFPNEHAAGATHTSGITPLHTILFDNKNVTRGMVQLLIDAHPESLGSESSTGFITPLHALSRNKSLDDTTAVDILGLLLERCPEAAQRTDSDINGVLPIHLAVMTSKSFEFCRMLVEAYPGSERIATSNGMVPFDLAFADGAVVAAKYLLGLYPESINVANRDGAYPIHRAIARVTRAAAPTNAFKIVQMLLDCDLNVASQKLDGSFPLCVVYFTSMSFGEDLRQR
jgi:ankyrin repeat protein